MMMNDKSFVLPCGIHNFNGFFSLWNFTQPDANINVITTVRDTVLNGCDATRNPNL